MVSVWISPALSGSIDADGVVRLSDGRTFDLSSVPGNGYNANRLGKINDRIQQAIDQTVLRTDLPVEDPDRTATAAELLAVYGNRVFISDADGTPNASGLWLTTRHVTITLAWDGTDLIPTITEVR